MLVWLALLSISAIIGGLSARHLSGTPASLASALLPPALFLACLLAAEILLPDQGGGASMWEVAFIVGGPAAAIASLCSHLMVRWAGRSRRI